MPALDSFVGLGATPSPYSEMKTKYEELSAKYKTLKDVARKYKAYGDSERYDRERLAESAESADFAWAQKYEDLSTKHEELRTMYLDVNAKHDVLRAKYSAQSLYEAIAHGDTEHRAWLYQKCHEYLNTKTVD